MQDIRRGKQQRSRAYHSALADRDILPRLLRSLDLRLADALGDMVAGSLGEAVSAMRTAAAAGEGSGGAGVAASAGPALLCSVVLSADSDSGGDDGATGIAFTPSQGEWMAALEAELVDGPLQLAASLPSLLTRPVFQHYQEALGGGAEAASLPPAAGGLALEGREFAAAAAAELRTLLQRSFEEAERVARQQYHQYAAVLRWLDAFEFEAWAAQHRLGRRRLLLCLLVFP